MSMASPHPRGTLSPHRAGPDRDPVAPEGRRGSGGAVVVVGWQGVRGPPALGVPLLARHLGATRTTAALHADALGPGLHRGLDGPLHGPPKRDATGKLVGDTL